MSAGEFLRTLTIRPLTLFFEAGRMLIFRLTGNDWVSTALMILIEAFLLLPVVRRVTGLGYREKELNEKQRKTDRNNRILMILCCLYMAILTGLFVSSAALAFGTFVLWGILYGTLLSPKDRKHFTRSMAVLAAVSAMDYMFFGKDYGFISSALQFETAISNHLEKVLLNTGCVLVTTAAVLFLCRKKRSVILRIFCLYGCIALTVMSVINISGMEKKAGEVQDITDRIKAEDASFRLKTGTEGTV